MKHVLGSFLVLIGLCTMLAAGSCGAQKNDGDGNGPPDGKGKHEMPQEFTDACSGKSEGDACTVSMKDGKEMTSTCQKGPHGDDDTLACMPKPKDGKGPGKPPKRD